MTRIDKCEAGKVYTLSVCDLEKDQENLLYYMGLGVGSQFKITKTDKHNTIIQLQNTFTKLGISNKHTSKMYATT